MKKLILLFSAVFLFGFNNFSVEISGDTLNARAKTILMDTYYVRANYLYNDKSNRDDFYSVGISADGQLVGVDYAGMNVSLFSNFVQTTDNSAVSFGVELFSYLPIAYPVYNEISFEYAPKILTFDDCDRFSRFRITFGIKPIENARIFAGYRNISFNSNYDNSFFAGIGFDF